MSGQHRSPLLPAPVLPTDSARTPLQEETEPQTDDERIKILEHEHVHHTQRQQSPVTGLGEDTPLMAGKRNDSSSSLASLDEQPKKLSESAGILIALVALIACRTVDQVLYYRLARMYASYTWALGAIILSAGYLIVLWPVVWYKMFVSGEITVEHRQFPQKALIIMALFDTLGNVIGTWPLPYIPSSMTNVLSNSVLPFTMICSMIFLGTRYKWTHYTGAILVVLGIIIRLIPSFSTGEKEPLIMPAVWIPVYFIALVPSALSNVYKEGGLKGLRSNIWHVNAWVGVWQLLMGFVTMPTVFIPWSGTDVIKPSDLGSYLSDASTCFFLGRNPRPNSPDQCEGIFFIFILFLIFNVAFNQLMLVVFKKGSSVLAVISSTARLPLVDALLLWGFLAGTARIQSITIYDIFALLVIIAGIVTYKYHKEEKGARERIPGVNIQKEIGSSAVPSPAVDDTRKRGKGKRWTPSFMQNRPAATGFSPAFPKRF